MMIRKGSLLAVTMVVSTLMACAHGPEGYRPPGSKSDGLRVVQADEAEKTRLPEWSLAVPLGEKEDDSVLEFLERAEAAGARYVSDVDVVFAARQGSQVLACRTHVQPVMTFERGARPVMLSVPETRARPVNGLQQCKGNANACSAGATPPPQEGPLRYVARPATDMPARFLVRRWKLQKSAPECTPLEGGMEELEGRFLRVEGRAYGCSDASASGCEDKVL